jgi:Ca2+-binding RTX toxin-like protein
MALVKGKIAAGEVLDDNDGITDGADTIIGNNGADHIYAGGGQDVIKGGGGADTIDGGDGRDTATYEDSGVGVDVNLVTGKGKGGTAEGDTLKNIEDLFGSKFDDKLVGNAQDNKLDGQDGNDTLKGGGGADTLVGGAGNDVLEIDGTDDKAYGGAGIDTLVANSGYGLKISLSSGFIDYNPYSDTWGVHNPRGWQSEYGYDIGYPHPYGSPDDVTDVENVIGSKYNDAIFGNESANNISGVNGDDLLSGLGGDDIISGGNGNDWIYGGLGADTLTGGADADTFIFSSFDASKFTAGRPQDIITDFQHGLDAIDLSALDIALNDLLVVDNQTIGGANYSYVGVDANHNGQFDEGEFAIAVKLAPGSTLHASDFIF